MGQREKELEAVNGWSCKERDRTACRNADGCHCREITALRNTVDHLRSVPHEPRRTSRLPSTQSGGGK